MMIFVSALFVGESRRSLGVHPWRNGQVKVVDVRCGIFYSNKKPGGPPWWRSG